MSTDANILEQTHAAVQKLREISELRGRDATEMRTQLGLANDRIDALQKELEKRAAPTIPAASGAEMSLETRSIHKYIRYGAGDGVIWTPEERRSLAGTADADGGFLVPDDASTTILMNAYDQSELMPFVNRGTTGRDVFNTGSLSKPVVGWGTTGVAVTDQTLTTGQVKIEIKPLQALVLISEDTLSDAAADLNAEVFNAFAEAIAEAKDDAIVVGTGAQQPVGVLTLQAVKDRAVVSGISSLLVDATHNGFDVLYAAYMSLNKKYRRNATFALNSATERVLRTSKNAEGNYIWHLQGSLGEANTLLGRPVASAEGMPDIAANAFPIVVGDFSRYSVRDRTGVVIQRLVERYAEFGQVGFRIKHRTGGAPLLAEAFTPVKIST